MNLLPLVCWDSSVGIATGCTAGVRFPEGQDYPLLHSVQTPIQKGTGAPLPGDRGVKLTTHFHLVPR
jgi:hypothetical protein